MSVAATPAPLNTNASKPLDAVLVERERRRVTRAREASADPATASRRALAAEEMFDPRHRARHEVALPCWAMKPTGTQRGYVLDISEDGARLGGISSGFVLGQGMLLKIELAPGEAAVILRAEAVRWQQSLNGGRQLAVRFLEVPFDDWFRLARFLDAAH